MAESPKKVLFRALHELLKPIVRFCLRRSLKFQDLVEAAKVAFVEVAADEMVRVGAMHSKSKICVMTGIHRRDVTRLSEGGAKPKAQPTLLTRVIGQWRADQRFLTSLGRPRVLEAESKQSEFVQLVESVSKDVNPYTVLFELERCGLVQREGSGVKLLSTSYVPKELRDSLSLLAADVNDLIESVSENIFETPTHPNLHIKTEFDNIGSEAIPEIISWLLREGSDFHHKVERYLSSFDRDVSPNSSNGSPVRVVIGSFARTTIRINELKPQKLSKQRRYSKANSISL